jgi:hypothetical protein
LQYVTKCKYVKERKEAKLGKKEGSRILPLSHDYSVMSCKSDPANLRLADTNYDHRVEYDDTVQLVVWNK